MTLDLRSVRVQVLVGGLDLSPAFLSLSIGGNALDDSGWFKPRGQIVLAAYADGVTEDMDCRTNPGRWAPGTVVAVSVWLGSWVSLPWRLRILSYPNRPSPAQPTITLEVGTDADLLNYRAPEGDPGTDEYGTPAGATTLINRALTQAGAPSLAVGDTITTLSLPFSPEKNTGGSWMTYAGTVAYAARHILWQQTDGTIRATPLTLDGLTPTAAYTVGTDEADYVLSPPGEQPPEVVQVQGTTYQIEAVQDESFVTDDIVDGVRVLTTVSYRDRGTFEPVYEEEVQQPANLVLPVQFPVFTGLIVGSRLVRTTTYNDPSARLEQEVEETYRPVAAVFPNQAWGTPTALVVSERLTTAYTYDSEDVLTRRVVTREIATIAGVTVTTKVAQITTEVWTKVGAEEYAYQRNQINKDTDTAALPELRGASTNNTPPATQYRPAEKQRTELPYSGKATFTNAVGSSYAEKLWSINLPSGMGVSASQCRAHAALWGKIRQGRQFSIQWGADLAAAWLTNFSPVARVDITHQGTTTAYLVEGFSLEIDQRSAAIGGMGLEIGQVDGANLLPPYVQIPDLVLAQSMQRMGGAVSIELTNALALAQAMQRMGAALDVTTLDSVTVTQSMGRMGAALDVALTDAVAVAQAMQRMGADVSVTEPWTPAQLSLTRWWTMESSTLFNAISGGGTPAADGAVHRIEDVSGNNRHATQATSGNAAIRKVASLNGRDSIRFDGVNDIYTDTGGAYASRWAIAVCRFDQAASKPFAGLYTSDTSQLILAGSGNALYTSTGYTVRRDGEATTSFTKQQPMIWFCDMGLLWNADKHFGAERNQNAGRYWIGDCWELIEGDEALTLADIQRLEGYLAHRLGLTANLPGGHPYKSVAP